MLDVEPNYSEYTDDELLDVLEHIDRHSYSERYLRIVKEIENRKKGISTQVVPPKPETKKGKKSERILVLVIWTISVLLAVYYKKIPTKIGMVTLEESPGLFVTCLIVFICVGIYFYNKRDDT